MLDADGGRRARRRTALFDVLRPYLLAVDPPSIAPCVFEEVLKHHCVADLNVDRLRPIRGRRRAVRGRGVHGVLSDGRSRWELVADTWIDAGALAASLPAAIPQGAAAVLRAIGG